ncbi:SigE family RNA polymerase sigma factor [Nocardioides terrigena]|uniref:SigE family RNA polymerase sigma factor n=1 Tax=Nocardioides terrigena TaxID=424797 RepID=UPI001F276E7A|nr:SigE family RNA polymerase sigma factor [Nocardioides terrigena]
MPRRDPAAFAEFVAARSAALHRSAYLMVGERQLAQDLLQEALTKTYVAWPTLRDPSRAEAYTRKVITTTAISWYRRKSWQERPSDAIPEVSTEARADAMDDDVARREWVWTALQALPPRQRAAIVLRYYEDLTEAQTAAALGCAVGTVKSQVHAGLASLRKTLDAHGGEHLELLPRDLMVVTR